VAKHEQALKQHPALKVPEPALAVPSGPMRHEVAAPRPGNGREAGTHPRRARRMARVEVPCFSAKRMPYSKIPEFDRQLVGQEKGLNALTIHEYVAGRAAFTSGYTHRDTQGARNARTKFAMNLKRDYTRAYVRQGHAPEVAATMARHASDEKMNALAALHNPDLISGGKDIISDFGDRQVNSSLGPQWRSRVKHLDAAIQEYISVTRDDPRFDIRSETMNASLERCQ
jgi:hypothetical protein